MSVFGIHATCDEAVSAFLQPTSTA
jgi:hypothetical protein